MPVDRKAAEALLDNLTVAVAANENCDGYDPLGTIAKELDEARAAVLDAMTLKEGWVLVPKVPTNEMLEQMNGYAFTDQEEAFHAVDCYTAMLAAAPQKEDKP
jgi:hypothetical protein